MKESEKEERIKAKIEEHKEVIKEAYGNERIYIKTEYGRDGKYEDILFITVECIYCKRIKKATVSEHKQKRECKCKKEGYLKKSIEDYALELFRDLKKDNRGLLIGQELEEYIRASALYDRGELANIKGYKEKIYDCMIDIYEKEDVFICDNCKKLYPDSIRRNKKIKLCKICINKRET